MHAYAPLCSRLARETAAYGPLASAPPCICCISKGWVGAHKLSPLTQNPPTTRAG